MIRAALGVAMAAAGVANACGSAAAYPDTTVSGAGYGCERTFGCDPNDNKCLQYVLRPEIRTFTIKNSAKFFKPSDGQDVEFITRTWSADLERSDFNSELLESVCGEYSNDGSILGPCIEARPGYTHYVRLENELDLSNVTASVPEWLSVPPSPDQFVALAQSGVADGPYATLEEGGFVFHNKAVKNTTQYGISYSQWKPGQEWNNTVAARTNMTEVTKENTAGSDTTFQRVNMHWHGMEVVPHLFHPQGTSNPAAEWIQTIPDSEITPEQVEEGYSKCYTYNFTVPTDHPSGGTYWYHTHRHGAVAAQTWSGMAGLIVVPGAADDELRVNYEVTREEIFVIWDPHLVVTERVGQPDIAQVGRWLDNQNNVNVEVPFLVNNEYQPEFDLAVNEIVRFRVLCATTENMCGFTIVEVPDNSTMDDACELGLPGQDFSRIGSDGILFSKAETMTKLVLGGGQREELLVRMNATGNFAVCQQGLSTEQFFGTGPETQALAAITVKPETTYYDSTVLDLADISLTPGIPANDGINAVNIMESHSIIFSMGSDSTNSMPFPQFHINDKSYEVEGAALENFWLGEAKEFVLYNSQKTVHPFHIHVNAFQVKEVVTAYGDELNDASAEHEAFAKYLTDQAVGNHWRDTVLIPPMGHVRIWVRAYNYYVGKTAFHCHFLAHEDTGMIANMMIGYSPSRCARANAQWTDSCDTDMASSFGNLPLQPK